MPEFDITLLLYGLVIGLVAGVFGGVLAGLAGVGGGLIYVPLFYAFLPGAGEGMGLHIFASLVAVVLTGFFSSRSHWRLDHVDTAALRTLLPGLIVGAALGLWMTLRLPEMVILLALAALNAWVAFDYGRKPVRGKSRAGSISLLSGPIGFVSGALGIGGGTMLVPLLRRFVALRLAVGTSAVCGMVMALGAVAFNSLLEAVWMPLLSSQALLLAGLWLGVLLALHVSTAAAARVHANVPEETVRLILKSIFSLLSAGLLIAAMLT